MSNQKNILKRILDLLKQVEALSTWTFLINSLSQLDLIFIV